MPDKLKVTISPKPMENIIPETLYNVEINPSFKGVSNI